MKNFEDFAKGFYSHDWPELKDNIYFTMKQKAPFDALIETDLMMHLSILRAYHNWFTENE